MDGELFLMIFCPVPASLAMCATLTTYATYVLVAFSVRGGIFVHKSVLSTPALLRTQHLSLRVSAMQGIAAQTAASALRALLRRTRVLLVLTPA
jgi:hypothetical protein